MEPSLVTDDNLNTTDLLNAIRIVWQGKWIIVAATFMGLLLSILYLAMVPKKYALTVPYGTVLYSIETLNFCGNNEKCRQAETKAMLMSHNDTGWSIGKDPVFRRTVSSTSSNQAYFAELEQIRQKANRDVQASAEREIDVLQKEIPKALGTTETFARHLLVATRLKTVLAEDGTQVITLGRPTIQSMNRPNWIVVATFFFAGLFGGLALVVLRHFVKHMIHLIRMDKTS